MDPNFEGPKIPLMTLAGITSLTDVLHELPLPGPHPDVLDCPLFAYATVPMPGIHRLVSSSNPTNIMNIVDALSHVSTDEIVLKNPAQDTDCLEGLNVPPLLQAVLGSSPNIFSRRKSTTTERGGNITGIHHSPVQAATPQSPAISNKGLPLYQRSPAECAASELSLHNVQDGRPMQMHARNQPPYPAQNDNGNSAGSMNTPFGGNSSQQPPSVPEETPKLRLKIKRKPKPSKEQNPNEAPRPQESRGDFQYDIVSGPVEQATKSSSGSLKLKLSRVKHEAGGNPGPFNVESNEKLSNTDTHRADAYQTIGGNATAPPMPVNPSQPSNVTGSVPAGMNLDMANGFNQPQTQYHSNVPMPTQSNHPKDTQYQKPVQNIQVPPYPVSMAQPPSMETSKSNQAAVNYQMSGLTAPNTPRRKYNTPKGSSGTKSKKKNSQHVRVKFIADQEEADIHKLKDILYPDDSEVPSFSELKSGMMVVAKWPHNGKMYDALVIDPLDNSGRKARERKQVQPFQINPGARERTSSSSTNPDPYGSPRVVLEPLPSYMVDAAGHAKFTNDTHFSVYHSMADRIKLKRKRLSEGRSAKKQKLNNNQNRSIITMSSDDDDASPNFSREKSSKNSKKKFERRRKAEMRMMREGGRENELSEATAWNFV